MEYGTYRTGQCPAGKVYVCLQMYKRKNQIKTNATVWFDKTCRIINLTPRYINIVVKGNNQQSLKAKKMTTTYKINQNQSAFVGLSIHFILPINPRNVEHTKFTGFCVFVKYSPH